MAAPSGIAGQIGFKTESVWSTAVVVDQFHPGLLSESITNEITRIDSQGIRAGRRVNHSWASGSQTIGGDIELELWNRPSATLLTHIMGTVNTTGIGPYVHDGTPGDLTGKGLTIQVGRPDVGGTVRPFTYAGCRVASWSLSADVDSIPTLTLTITAATETTGTGLAVASYPASAAPFSFVHGAVSIAGSSIATVRSFSIEGDNALATDRFRVGSATVLQQLEQGKRTYTGELSMDFSDLTAYGRVTAGTEAAVVLSFTSGTDVCSLTFNARFDGATPNLSGIELLEQSLSFVATSGTSDAAAFSWSITNAETSAT